MSPWYVPDPRDFAAWMEYKQAEAARQRARGTRRVVRRGGDSTSMQAYEAYLRELSEQA